MASATHETMQCPKCGVRQPAAAECAHCGVVVAKARRDRPPASARGPQPAPAAPRPSVADGVQHGVTVVRATLRAGVSARARAMLYTQLARMLDAGMPVATALDSLAHAVRNPRFTALCAGVGAALREGAGFAAALARFPQDVPPVEARALGAAEVLGKLPQGLTRIAERLDRRRRRRQRVLTGLIYPTAVVVLSFFMLPLGHLILGRTGVYLRAALVPLGAVVLLVALAAVFAPRLAREAAVRRGLALARARLPVLGGLSRAQAVADFCEQLAFGLEAGQSPGRALADAVSAAAHPDFDAMVHALVAEVQEGGAFGPALGRTGLFPDAVVLLVTGGEHAGTLAENLRGAVRALDDELAARHNAWTRVASIVLTVAMLGYVGLCVMSELSAALTAAQDALWQELPGGANPMRSLDALREALDGADEVLRGPALRPMP